MVNPTLKTIEKVLTAIPERFSTTATYIAEDLKLNHSATKKSLDWLVKFNIIKKGKIGKRTVYFKEQSNR